MPAKKDKKKKDKKVKKGDKKADKKGGKKLNDAQYAKIAAKLNDDDWKSILGALAKPDKKALTDQLDTKKDILKSRKKADNKKAGLSKSNKKDKASKNDRKISYRFGSRNVQCLKPSTGYPDKKAAKRAVAGKLKLFYAHGYSGNFDESRQNIYLSQDGKFLIYYIAAVIVVYDYGANTQKFFTMHNDDVTTICLSPKKTWCASGQKDPKDEPGKGKDLPKIYVWNYKTMKSVCLIDNVCWGKIARVNWSTKTNYLYCICGDPDQTLKAWDPKVFDKKNKEPEPLIKCNTMREIILGFEINPNPGADSVDEFLVFGKRKFAYAYITKGAKKGLASKFKAVSIVSFKKDGEKSFACGQFLDDGRYIVGSSSGTIYVGRANQALAIYEGAHDRAVGAMKLLTPDKLLTAGSDRKFKTFKISDTAGGKGAAEAGLEKDWECVIEVKESDMVLQPRAMAYNKSTGTVFCGTKTNQIVKFEMKSEETSVIVDGHDGQIWGLSTSPKLKLFATGGYDNAVKVWNASTMKCIATYEFDKDDDHQKGYQVCSAAWSNNGDILAFGTEDSNIGIFTFRNNELVFKEMINIPPKNDNAEIEGVAYLRFSDDSKLLAAAHMDSQLYIYSVTGYDGSDNITLEQWAPMPHIAAPTNVQFTADGKMVKTLTRDYEICHWSLDSGAKKGKLVVTTPDPDKTKWADDPLIAGWDTQGLYQPGWDGTDLNDATVTSDNKLIVSGDDYGTVRLHNYPAIDPSACIEYTGHAEFVVGVEFLRDDSQLITCGGNDMAIFQWKLIKSKGKKK